MKSIVTSTLLTIALSGAIFAQAASECSELQQRIKATYNFKPSKLPDADRTTKSAAMDQFWETVKARPKQLLPCLRTALQDPNADKWFRFDASNLLVELDSSAESKAIQIRSYTDVDLDDADLHQWVTVLSGYGYEGFDISEAGNKWLAYPRASYFLPAHGAHEVKSVEGALFLFGSMDETAVTPALLKIVSQANHPGREAALMILMSQATPESLKALKQLDASGFSAKVRISLNKLLTNPSLLKPRAKPKTTREEFVTAFQKLLDGNPERFLELVSNVSDGEKDVIAVLKAEDLPLVRKVRRRMAVNGNQHALEYYFSFTAILMAMVWNPELVR